MFNYYLCSIINSIMKKEKKIVDIALIVSIIIFIFICVTIVSGSLYLNKKNKNNTYFVPAGSDGPPGGIPKPLSGQ